MQMRQGVATWQSAGAQSGVPHGLSLIAEAFGNANQVEEGLRVITEALEHINRTRERIWEAELYRLRGDFLLKPVIKNEQEAETCFHQALKIARYQQAKFWELRATTSLARLWQSQGKREEARELLTPVYSWFTEGLDTADLKDAKSLLDALA